MVRTQIQLTPEQAQELRQIAHEENVSVAELIRRSVDQYLDSRYQPSRAELKRKALAMIGSGSSGLGDVAENHDRYLDEVYGDSR